MYNGYSKCKENIQRFLPSRCPYTQMKQLYLPRIALPGKALKSLPHTYEKPYNYPAVRQRHPVV